MPDSLTPAARALLCARLSHAAYGSTDAEVETRATAQGFAVVQHFSDAGTDTRAFLGYNAATKAIVLALRGTVGLQNANIDLWQELTGLSDQLGPDVKVVTGFSRAYETVENAIMDAVERKVADLGGPGALNAFYFTGHSLGGALATYAGVQISLLLKQKYNLADPNLLRVVTMAAPPTGSTGFCTFYLSLGNLFSSVNYRTPNDSVASGLWTVAPGVQVNFLTLGYGAAGPVVTLPSTAGFPDAHYLSTYVALLVDAARPGGPPLQTLRIYVTTGSGSVAPWYVPDSPGTTRDVTLTIGGGSGEPQISEDMKPRRALTMAELVSDLTATETSAAAAFEPGTVWCDLEHPETLSRQQLKRWSITISGGGFWNSLKSLLGDQDKWNLAGIKIVADEQIVYDNQAINTIMGISQNEVKGTIG